MDNYYSKKENLATFETMVLEDQVVDWVLDHAQIEDEPLSFQQLTDEASR